jgi:serine/threonine protein kinase/Tol biopolymer transport system component
VNRGDTIGHYRIIDPLGKGGMGEVFAAEDMRLHRRVALKILPPIFAADPAYRQRFEREAQAVAALNHPNIVTIHSVEEDNGRLFLTMELVDGRPLSDLIPPGGVPIERLLRIGAEVADAMAAAQEQGITHRDLKPGNVMVTSSGRAKVLDFGLAKLREAESAPATDDVTRMAQSDVTGEGKIIGTVAYMSPEQAEGKAVDPRSDIFSLGVVLHEMATGDRPFKGDTNVSILSSILKDTPPSVTDSNPALPADLSRIVRRCLAKDPSRRYQTAADLRNDLDELKQDTSTGVLSGVRPAVVRPRARFRRAGIAAAGLAVAALSLFLLKGRWLAPSPPTAFTIDRMSRLTTTGSAFMAAISPDGRYVVHVKRESAGYGLWMRQASAASDVRIVPPADVRFDGVAFSRDGDFVFYSAYPGSGGVASLFKIPVLGGQPSRILEDIDSAVSFSPDGRQMAFVRGDMQRGVNEVMIASADGSAVRTLGSPKAPDVLQPEAVSWSPDGKTILATTTSTHPIPCSVFAFDVATGDMRTVGEPWAVARDVQWLPDGRSFLIAGLDTSGMGQLQLWQLSYPSGARTRVTNDLNTYIGTSVSADGRTAATVQTETVASLYVIQGTGDEPRRLTTGADRADGTQGIAWLPDGRVVYTSTATGLPQLWIVNGDGSNDHELTTQVGQSFTPATSPDGRWVYFSSYAKEGISLFRVAPDGSGFEQLTRNADARGPVVSPDGASVYYTTGGSQPRLMKVPAAGGAPQQVSQKFFRAYDVSADGRQFVGVTWDATQRRTVLAVYTPDGDTLQRLPELPTTARFLPDGQLLTLDRVNGKSVLVARALTGGAKKVVTPAFAEPLFGAAVSRDGRIVVSKGQSTSDVVLIKAK